MAMNLQSELFDINNISKAVVSEFTNEIVDNIKNSSDAIMLKKFAQQLETLIQQLKNPNSVNYQEVMAKAHHTMVQLQEVLLNMKYEYQIGVNVHGLSKGTQSTLLSSIEYEANYKNLLGIISLTSGQMSEVMSNPDLFEVVQINRTMKLQPRRNKGRQIVSALLAKTNNNINILPASIQNEWNKLRSEHIKIRGGAGRDLEAVQDIHYEVPIIKRNYKDNLADSLGGDNEYFNKETGKTTWVQSKYVSNAPFNGISNLQLINVFRGMQSGLMQINKQLQENVVLSNSDNNIRDKINQEIMTKGIGEQISNILGDTATTAIDEALEQGLGELYSNVHGNW